METERLVLVNLSRIFHFLQQIRRIIANMLLLGATAEFMEFEFFGC
jgi:hypothetical protein